MNGRKTIKGIVNDVEGHFTRITVTLKGLTLRLKIIKM